MSRFTSALCGAAFLLATFGGQAHAVTIQPNEANSKDTFVYQFLPGFNFNSGGFATLLSAGSSGGTGHDTESMVQFDLAPLGLTAAQVTSATFEIWAVTAEAPAGPGFGHDPDASHPVTIDLYSVGGASPSWTEDGVSWGGGMFPTPTVAKPTAGGLVTSTVMTGINQWISFDVTTLVQSWLNGSLANNGLLLRQQSFVPFPDPPQPPSSGYVGVFSSASGANAPRLTLAVVPEPSTWLLAMAGLVAVLVVGRRRRVATIG